MIRSDLPVARGVQYDMSPVQYQVDRRANETLCNAALWALMPVSRAPGQYMYLPPSTCIHNVALMLAR